MPKLVKKSVSEKEEFLANTLRIASLADERKAINICAYDLRGLTLLSDTFVICSASSEPQIKAVYDRVLQGMKEIGVSPLRREGTPTSQWLVLDYGNIIFHLFREDARDYYDLDGLWGDAPRVDLGIEGGQGL